LLDDLRGPHQGPLGRVCVAARGGQVQCLSGVQPGPRRRVEYGTDLLAGVGDQGKPELGVAGVGLERGQAA